MALDSQSGLLQSVSGGDLSGLVHEIFAGDVKNQVKAKSATADLFKEVKADAGYRLDGEKLVGAAQLLFAGGAMGSSSTFLPDSMYQDAANWEITPVPRYIRRAINNFDEARARKGPGAFGDLAGRLFDQMWDAWFRMTVRHAVGTSTGTVCKCSSRTSSTVWVAKDGYGHAGTSPLIHLEKGMTIAWLDAGASNTAAGAGVISSINFSTAAITMGSAATWEPSAQLAANDLIVFATTSNIATDYFDTEYESARNGLMDIVDPDAVNTTVFAIAEGTYPRWKPFREASTAFDHIEVTEHWQKLRAKSYEEVTPSSHVSITHGAVIAELARSMEGFQQATALGGKWEGGYTEIGIAGGKFRQDDYQLHDVLYTVCRENLQSADLGGEAAIYDEDGSRFRRLNDQDAKEWFARDYGNTWSDRRNRHAALTGITLTNVTASDFDPVPNY